MTQDIYCKGFGDTLRVEYTHDWVEVRPLIFLETLESIEGDYFSINPSKVIAVDWSVQIKAKTVVRVFVEGGHSVDVDPLTEKNRSFFIHLTHWQDDWLKYLSPYHKQKLHEMRTPTYPEGGEG